MCARAEVNAGVIISTADPSFPPAVPLSLAPPSTPNTLINKEEKKTRQMRGENGEEMSEFIDSFILPHKKKIIRAAAAAAAGGRRKKKEKEEELKD